MTFTIRRAAVIGAGTMGAQIAAHLANAGIPVLLLDVAPETLTPAEAARGRTLDHPDVRNRIVNEGLARAKKLTPPALMSVEAAALITTGNVVDDIGKIAEADWIIEAIVEQLAPKRAMMERIDAHRRPGSIVSSNTSGIPIRQIAEGRSEDFRAHFLGTHFFNPPRYLKLLEVIPTAETHQEVVAFVRSFGERTLGKGVVVCKDTPNFIANRLGSIGSAYTMHLTLQEGFTVEEVDALTGPLIGRPKTAFFRLADLIGIDVSTSVRKNLYELIPADPDREILRDPTVNALEAGLAERGLLGRKTGKGFYQEVRTGGKREFRTLDLTTFEHRPPQPARFPAVDSVRHVDDLGARLRALVALDDRAGRFIWRLLSHSLAYAANRVGEIADSLDAIDNAMKWGYGHELGPFEVWDALGVAETAKRMVADGLRVPVWVEEMLANGCTTFYGRAAGRVVAVYDPASRSYRPIPPDPNVISLPELKLRGQTVRENASASLIDLGDGVACLEFHTKLNALDNDVLDLTCLALEEVERRFVGLVIGNQGEQFSAGANLFLIAGLAHQGEWQQIDKAVRLMQETMTAIRRSAKPVVVAPHGLTLGGAAEVMMSGTAICAAAESYIGLVETGVGLIPAGGGCKELLRRVVSPAMKTPDVEVLPFLEQVFQQIAFARVGNSAAEARLAGFLTLADRIAMNRDHLLAEAKRHVLDLAESGHRPTTTNGTIYAAGRDALAALRIAIYDAEQSGRASAHDVKIANKLAYVLCGGDLSEPEWVDEQYILDLEREAFVSLCAEQKTLERIAHTLQTGKPLRN